MKSINKLRFYIAREHIMPFIMSLTIFTFILIMDKIFYLTDLIIKYSIPAIQVLKLLIYILPATFAITIPMACLVAVMVAFSRLKADNELTAIKASGISIIPLINFVILLGVGLTCSMIWFNNNILPKANAAYVDLYFNIVSQRATIVIQEHVFVEDFEGYVFRVDHKDPKKNYLQNVVVFIKDKHNTDLKRTILAKSGQLITDSNKKRVYLKLHSGFMQIGSKKNPETFSKIDFSTALLDLDINQNLNKKNKNYDYSPREMNLKQIKEQISKNLKDEKNSNWLWVEYHKKFSIPFACLSFILIGAPLGILAPRSGRYFAYFAGVILIFIYYILISSGEYLGIEGEMSPFMSMWLPNILITGFGLFGLLWVLLEKFPLFLLLNLNFFRKKSCKP